MYPFINIGSVAIPTKAFIYLIAVWVGLFLLEQTSARLKQDRATLYSIATQALFFGLIGARFVFVITHWSAYSANWMSIFWPLNSGYSIWGGLLISISFIILTIRTQQLSYGHIADAAMPTILLLLTAIFLADFLAGPGFGAPLNWGRLQFHPVQFYELIVVVSAAAVWWYAHTKRPFAGSAFLLSLATLTFGLLLTTPFRGNTWVSAAGWYPLQIAYLSITCACLFAFTAGLPPKNPSNN